MTRKKIAVLALFAVVLPLVVAGAAEAPEAAVARARELVDEGSYEVALGVLRDSLAEHPDDPSLLLELGRTAEAQADEILRSTSPTLGRLALFDAMRWFERAAGAKPDLADAWRGLGRTALAAGDFDRAIHGFTRATEVDPTDGESFYQLGFALAWRGRSEEALVAFEKAGRFLGADPRILLNRGIATAALGRIREAEELFLDLIRIEAAAERTSSANMQSGLQRLWKLHADREDWAGAEAAFATVTKDVPELAGGWWYLGHARLNADRPADAAAALAKVTEIVPGWTDGWSRLGEARIAAGDPDAATAALEALAALDPGGPATSDLLVATIGALVAADRTKDALSLLDRTISGFGDDPLLLERRGDLLFRLGRHADALLVWRAAAELDPFGHEVRVKEAKAATALLRSGEVPGDLVPREPREARAPVAGKEVSIEEFETSTVFARVNGAATGVRTGEGFRLRRRPDATGMANVSLTMIPTMDTRPFASLRFRVRGPAGRSLLVLAKDAYDQFEVTPGFVRLAHAEPVRLTGEVQTVTLPLDGFAAVAPNRPIPMNRARLRALIFEIGAPLPGAPAAPAPLAEEVLLGPVELVRPDGAAETIESFAGEPAETLFLTTGAATAFARTLFSPDQVAGFRPDPNTFVTPAIFGEDYDPADVFAGEGAFRMTLTGEGPAAGTLQFNPDRSFEGATAFTFRAKGRLGGERLRVTFRDALDGDIGNDAPASAPRLETRAHVLRGHFVLTAEWKEYRIDLADYPDVDLRSLLEISFEFGTPEGNPRATTIHLDALRHDI